MMRQSLEDFPSVESRHVDIERDRIGPVLMRRGETAVTIETDDSLESFIASHCEQSLRKVRIVLENEHRPVTRLDVLVIILDDILRGATLFDRRRRIFRCALARGRTPRRRTDARYPRRVLCRSLIVRRRAMLRLRTESHGKEKSERASFARCAVHSDLTAKQA